MTPRGRYRSALEKHLRETRDHATRVAARRRELDGGGDALGAIVGIAQDAVGQTLALAKAPLDIVRGSGGEEKVLKNAKDACASEALEIATYIALEHLARSAGDTQTAELAASIRGDEEAMLERIQRRAAGARAGRRARRHRRRGLLRHRRDGRRRRSATPPSRRSARRAHGAPRAKRTATRQARRVPGATQAEGAAKGAVASERTCRSPATTR